MHQLVRSLVQIASPNIVIARPSNTVVTPAPARAAAGPHQDFSRIPPRAARVPATERFKSGEDIEIRFKEVSGAGPQQQSQQTQQQQPLQQQPQQLPQQPQQQQPQQLQQPQTKTAGVDSFSVAWSRNTAYGETAAKLLLLYNATFTKDSTHDPALADFRQNAFHKFECTAGPHAGQKDDNSPLHDDNYSRADDMAGNARNSTKFSSNDNPGPTPQTLDKDDVIDFSFTAEQLIIDTSQSNKQIAKKGPHTATIKGKHPRTFGGVPATL